MKSLNYLCKDKKNGKYFYTFRKFELNGKRHVLLGASNRKALLEDMLQKLQSNGDDKLTEKQVSMILVKNGVIITCPTITIPTEDRKIGNFNNKNCTIWDGKGKVIIIDEKFFNENKGKTFKNVKLKLYNKDSCFIAYPLTEELAAQKAAMRIAENSTYGVYAGEKIEPIKKAWEDELENPIKVKTGIGKLDVELSGGFEKGELPHIIPNHGLPKTSFFGRLFKK